MNKVRNNIAVRTAVLIAAVFIAVCEAACAKQSSAPQTGIIEMKGAELDNIMSDKQEKEEYLVIDVREKNEYDEGHVRYAINISLNDISNKLRIIDDLKDKNIITICRSGRRSKAAAEILRKNGFKKLFNAAGVSTYSYTSLTKVTNIRGKQMQELVNTGKYSVVDARKPQDYAVSHLKGAISGDADNITQKLAELPIDKPVLTYCYSGNRSFAVAEKLAAAGYTVINSLDGTNEYSDFELVK
ncbi:rhodanese-like domain-containing protein [Treponema sp.]|uniref:rhodanese-like domain-containing protein n=1 Tax=Treponema sp. TaxID=166 RepID=UPI003FA23C07